MNAFVLAATPARASSRAAPCFGRRVTAPRPGPPPPRVAPRASISPAHPVLAAELRNGSGQTVVMDGNVSIHFDFFDGDKKNPAVFFLPGFFFARDRRAKASALGMSAKRAGYAFLTADYFGTGRSDGKFEESGTLSRWIQDSVGMMDVVIGDRPVILVGSGIGGWIMLHVAQMRKNVVGLVGTSVSVDFTEDLVRPGLSEEQLSEIESNGFVDLPWGETSYPISGRLMEDAKQYLCLRGGLNSLPIDRPVRLIHGLDDEEVPDGAQRVLKLVDVLASTDVVASFVKGGDHVLEEEPDFRRLWRAVENVADCWYEYDLTSPSSG